MNDKGLIASAMQFRAEKKWKGSFGFFEKSLQELEAPESRLLYIYCFARMILCEYARTCLERDQEGDRGKAHNLLNQALEMAQKIKAKKDIEKVLAKRKLLTA